MVGRSRKGSPPCVALFSFWDWERGGLLSNWLPLPYWSYNKWTCLGIVNGKQWIWFTWSSLPLNIGDRERLKRVSLVVHNGDSNYVSNQKTQAFKQQITAASEGSSYRRGISYKKSFLLRLEARDRVSFPFQFQSWPSLRLNFPSRLTTTFKSRG